jgi:hypothetical protein
MRLEPIRSGWAAVGNGWAVFARTQEEAAIRFAQAQQLHTEIERRSAPEEERDDGR